MLIIIYRKYIEVSFKMEEYAHTGIWNLNDHATIFISLICHKLGEYKRTIKINNN